MDMYADSESDLDSIKQARIEIAKHLADWIQN